MRDILLNTFKAQRWVLLLIALEVTWKSGQMGIKIIHSLCHGVIINDLDQKNDFENGTLRCRNIERKGKGVSVLVLFFPKK